MPKRKPVQSSEETFGDRMARLRKQAGYTQRDLAGELGLSQRMVAYYETQTDHPPTHLLAELTEVFAVSADELLGLKPVARTQAPASERLYRRFRKIEKLPTRERKQLLAIIDAFLEKDRLARRHARG